jgi:hypothetical protein
MDGAVLTLVEQLRALGLSMGTVYPPHTSPPDDEGQTRTTQRYVCWTTDEAKANAAKDLGASLVPYKSFSGDSSCDGWEVNAVEVVT